MLFNAVRKVRKLGSIWFTVIEPRDLGNIQNNKKRMIEIDGIRLEGDVWQKLTRSSTLGHDTDAKKSQTFYLV